VRPTLGLVVVARGAGRRDGLAAPGTAPSSPLELRNDGIVWLLSRLGPRKRYRRTAVTRAARPDASDPSQRPAPLHHRKDPRAARFPERTMEVTDERLKSANPVESRLGDGDRGTLGCLVVEADHTSSGPEAISLCCPTFRRGSGAGR